MEVIHAKDSDSFVAIGGEKAARFRVAASAAMFKVMSDTLYRDKERATAREIICNAIDAHIEAGLADEPVDVTLTDDELTVADQGFGIPHAKIEDIYCTMFGSGKAQDKRVTGGFGLGSKAPFSITDHFTVTSCHKGVKSLYAMVASDPDEDGCPSAKRMMSTGTMNQGVTVSVPLREGQRRKIEQHIISIAKEGGMAVRLNGKLLDTPDYRGLREVGYGLLNQQPSERIHVLYANVLYPLDAHPDLDKDIAALNTLKTKSQGWLFYAKPSTIGITPAREALSYDDETIRVIKAMLKKAANDVLCAYNRTLATVLDEVVSKLKRHELSEWRNYDRLPKLSEKNPVGAEDVARAIVISRLYSDNIPKRDVALAMARRFKDHGRGLRLVASKTYSYNQRSRYGCVFDTIYSEHTNYVMRRVTRAVGVEAAIGFYRRDSASSKLVSPRRPQAYRYRGNALPLALHIGPNVSSLQASGHHGYFLATTRLNEATVDEVRARCKTLGIEVVEVEKLAPIVREKKPKPKEEFGPPCPPLIRSFNRSIINSHGRSYGSGHERVDLRVKQLGEQRYFNAVAIRTAKGTTDGSSPCFVAPYSQRTDHLAKLVKKHVGDVAMITHRIELESPLVAGAPRIERVVLDKLKARAKRRKPYESLYARLSMFGLGLIDGHLSHDTSFSRDLVMTSREHAHAAMRERYVPSEDRDEAYELWILAQLLFQGRYYESAHMDAEEIRVMLPLFAEWRAFAQPFEATRFGEVPPWHRTEHLKLLGSAFSHRDFARFKGEAREDFLHIIAELGRRHDNRKQKDAAK